MHSIQIHKFPDRNTCIYNAYLMHIYIHKHTYSSIHTLQKHRHTPVWQVWPSYSLPQYMHISKFLSFIKTIHAQYQFQPSYLLQNIHITDQYWSLSLYKLQHKYMSKASLAIVLTTLYACIPHCLPLCYIHICTHAHTPVWQVWQLCFQSLSRWWR